MKKIATATALALLVGITGISPSQALPSVSSGSTATRNLGNVYFGMDSAHLTSKSKMKLKKIVHKNKKAISFKVAGYVQNLGPSSNEKKLSKKRALKTRNYMRQLGVEVPIKTIGKGLPKKRDWSRQARRVTIYGNFVTTQEITVAVDDVAYTFGDALPTFTTDQDIHLDSLTCGVYASTDTAFATQLTATDLTVAGSPYVVHCTAVAKAGYKVLSITDGSLTVAQHHLAVDVDDQTIPFLGAYPTFTTSSDAEFTATPTCSVYETSDTSYATPKLTAALTVAGSPYVIHCTATVDGNRVIDSITDGALTVTPQQITVTAVNKTQYLGVAFPAFTTNQDSKLNALGCSVYSSSDTAYATPLTYTQTTVEGSPYVIHCAPTPKPGYEVAGNVNGTLTVTVVHLTVAAADKTMRPGSSFPVFTTNSDARITGKVCKVYATSDTTYTTELTSSDVTELGSPYVIHCSGATANAGYTIDGYTNGVLTVQTENITVTTASKTFTAGDASLPTLTTNQDANIASKNCGVYANTDSGFTTALAAGALSAAGNPYVIHCKDIVANAGYAVTSVADGVLLVSDGTIAAALMITGNSVARTNEAPFNTTETTITNSVSGDSTYVSAQITLYDYQLVNTLASDPMLSAKYFDATTQTLTTVKLIAAGTIFSGAEDHLLIFDKDEVAPASVSTDDYIILYSTNGKVYTVPVVAVYP